MERGGKLRLARQQASEGSRQSVGVETEFGQEFIGFVVLEIDARNTQDASGRKGLSEFLGAQAYGE